MLNDPRQPPPKGAFEAVFAPQMALDISEQATVRRFLRFNELASNCMMWGGSVIALLMPTLIATAPDRSGIPFTLACAAAGVISAIAGIFQRQRNIAVMSLTGLTMVSLFGLLATGVLHHTFVVGWKSEPHWNMVAVIYVLAWVSVGVWALVYVPAWLAVQAWRWYLQGIDLATLEKMGYPRANVSFEVPPKSSRDHW